MNDDDDDDYEQEESSSRHLLGAVEELLQRSHQQFISKHRRIPYRSKSLEDLKLHRENSTRTDSSISETTTTQIDLSSLAFDDIEEVEIQRCRSAPIFTTKIYDQELAPFLHGEEEHGGSQSFADHFVYNIDLSCSNETTKTSTNSYSEIFSDDDFSTDVTTNEPFVSLLHSPLLKTCLTITEENEEELEDLETNDSVESIAEVMPERLATIYESPSPQPILNNDHHMVSELQNGFSSSIQTYHDEISPTSSSSNDPSSCSSSSSPVTSDPNIPSSNTKEKVTKKSSIISNHIQIMKMIQSSASSLSDFITSSSPSAVAPAPLTSETTKTNLTHYEEMPQSNSSSTSNILYPIDFSLEMKTYSNRSISESNENSTNYRQILTDMSIIKKKLMNIELRLNETMRELEIEQALIEGEHELVFKRILDASDNDQDKIHQSHEQLEILIKRIMTDKTSIRKQIEATQKILRELEVQLQTLDDEYRSSDETILKKKEFLLETQKKYEDLEFQLMELETRCEVELEQAQEHFHKEQQLVSENAQLRQNLLRDLDHQQHMLVFQVSIEKERLEREKQRLKLLFEQKKLLANRCEEENLVRHPIKLRDRNRIQVKRKVCVESMKSNVYLKERPLTRYLPIRSTNFDLRAHIEGAGHFLDSSHINLTSTSCRGFLYKIGGLKFKLWNRRWFVFDRQRRSLSYFYDKNETKVRGSIDFQSIVEVYVEHIQSNLLRLPVPREATFVMKTNERTFYLVAPTVEAMRIWVDVLITGAEGNTFAGQN